MALRRVTRDRATFFELDSRIPPALAVQLGESFIIESNDAANGSISGPEGRLPGPTRTPPELNPVGGPVFVEGVSRGDVLVVNVEHIAVGEWGFTCWGNNAGGVCGPATLWPELGSPYSHIVKHVPGSSGTLADGKAMLNEFQSDFRKVAWDLAPFVGTIATAPDREVASSIAGQGPYGGNLDCRDIKVGTKVYLPVFHDGGLLFSGDVHASQGDTEFYGWADECSADVTYSCEVVRGKVINNPRLEKPFSLVSVYSAKPLEEAARRAVLDLMDWMISDYEMSPKEAYIHVCCNPDFRVNIYQMVHMGALDFTVGAELPKKYL